MPAGGELELTKQLNGRVRTFDAYLAAQKDRYRFYHLHEQVVVDWFKAIDANEVSASDPCSGGSFFSLWLALTLSFPKLLERLVELL